jgi:hypothetical protein
MFVSATLSNIQRTLVTGFGDCAALGKNALKLSAQRNGRVITRANQVVVMTYFHSVIRMIVITALCVNTKQCNALAINVLCLPGNPTFYTQHRTLREYDRTNTCGRFLRSRVYTTYDLCRLRRRRQQVTVRRLQWRCGRRRRRHNPKRVESHRH